MPEAGAADDLARGGVRRRDCDEQQKKEGWKGSPHDDQR